MTVIYKVNNPLHLSNALKQLNIRHYIVKSEIKKENYVVCLFVASKNSLQKRLTEYFKKNNLMFRPLDILYY